LARRACSTKGADASLATTDAGSRSAQIAEVSEPVPHPTSSQWLPGGTPSRLANWSALARLQRPMYAS